MADKKIHIAFVIANSSSVPYFLWFAEKAMSHPEFQFTFVSMVDKEPLMLEQLKQFNAACRWIRFDHQKRKRSLVKTIPKLFQLFKEIKPDIVHCHLFDDSLPGMIAAKLAGVKIRIVTKQDTYFHWIYAPSIVKFDRLVNKVATHIVAVSEECKAFILEKEKADPSKVSMIHHGINTERFCMVNQNYKDEVIAKFNLKNKKVIGTLARLIDWKGYDIILKVAEKIIEQHPDIIFLFIGQGELKETLEKTIAEKKLQNNVILTGYIEVEKIPSVYSIMDIYLHAARYEPFGFVIAEAMLMGIPVVSSRTGAALDAIDHKQNGYLVNYDDINGFVNGINYLLDVANSGIKEKGKEKAKQLYTFDRMWDGYISLYKKALN